MTGGISKSRMALVRSGAVLIIVLVTIMILSLSAYTFCTLMLTEDEATRLMGQRVRSRYLVESGVDYTRLFLSKPEQDIRELGGRYDNPEIFQNVVVSIDPDDPTMVGRFTIIASSLDDDGVPTGFRNGLVDESTKLNLNVLVDLDTELPGAGRNLLMAIPGMTEDVADAILDYIDPDDEIRDYGAESREYNQLTPPYAAKNAPMDSLEELLLVRGVTPQLLFGLDSNHNGIVDEDEMNSSLASGIEPELQLGWVNYMTLYSKETNLNLDGLQRININAENLEQLYTDLRSTFDERWSNYVIGYRQNGPAQASGINGDGIGEIDFEKEAEFEFESVLDLVDGITTVSFTDTLDQTVASPVTSENFNATILAVMANLTTVDAPTIPGRININQASRQMLLGIPGMTEEIADEIIRARFYENEDPDGLLTKHRNYETWIAVEGIVDIATMKTMLPFICVGGSVYRAEVVGYFSDGRGTSRAEVIIDKTRPIPRLVFWRDKSHLDRGYSAELLGLDLIE